MPTVYVRTNPFPSLIGTGRTITIPTSPATLVVSLSGYMGWQLTNVGVGAIAWGDSNVTASTGGILYYSMAKEWYPIADTMSTYLIADSVSSVVQINDYL